MSAIQYVEYILDNEWEESIDGRWNDVPEPWLGRENENTKETLRTKDVVEVQDGGSMSKEPASLGWLEETKEYLVTIDIRTADRRLAGEKIDGRVRLEGERNENNESERYGGLTGEVERILDLHRRGDKEYDLVEGFEINDVSGTTGRGHYRATAEVRLHEIAQNIDPSVTLDG